MPKGLMNADPMFFRMMMDILKDQMYINVFAYVDDIMVACKKKRMQIDDNRDLHKHARAQLKHNPEKCVFGVQRGKVLGCLVSIKEMEAHPDKINAIVHMKPPQSKK
jgi:hypothetical protein